MTFHLDLHLGERLKSLGRAIRDRLVHHNSTSVDRATVAPEPTVGVRPEATPSDGIPMIYEASPSAVTIRATDPLTPDQLAYGEDAFHPDDARGGGLRARTTDDDALDDGRSWMEALATESIESGPVGRRPLVVDADGTIRRSN